MRWTNDPWSVLGLKPTNDRRAIRKAYAAKLKAIDPDQDIAGFQALRSALETAEYLAKHAVQQDDNAGDEHGTDAGPFAGAGAAEPPAAPARRARRPRAAPQSEASRNGADPAPAPGPVQAEVAAPPPPPPPPPEVDPAQALAQRLAWLINSGPADAARQAEMHQILDQLLADRRMETIDFAADFEDWLANLLAFGGPGGDSLALRASDHFGWASERTAINPRQAPLIAAQRADDWRCITALSDPGHRWNAAYTLLSAPLPEAFSRRERIHIETQVRSMLESLEFHNPAVVDRLNQDNLRYWREYLGPADVNRDKLFQSTGVSWYTWLMLAWFVVMVLRFVAAAGDSGQPDLGARPAPTPPPVVELEMSPSPSPVQAPAVSPLEAAQQEKRGAAITRCVERAKRANPANPDYAECVALLKSAPAAQ